TFFCSKNGGGDGFTDSQGELIRGDWHPYMMIMNDEDPLQAKRRHATVLFGTHGRVNGGVGQGIDTREVVGTDEDRSLEQFKIVGESIGIDNGLTTIMSIRKTDGKWGFNTSKPSSDYHFIIRRQLNESDVDGSFRIQNIK